MIKRCDLAATAGSSGQAVYLACSVAAGGDISGVVLTVAKDSAGRCDLSLSGSLLYIDACMCVKNPICQASEEPPAEVAVIPVCIQCNQGR